MKRMNICVPDSLYESLREQAFHKKTSMSKIIVAGMNDTSVSTEASIQKEPPPPSQSESKLPCDAPFCKTTSEGKYRFISDQGDTEKTMNLCVYHWHKARKEGEVHAL